MKVLEQESVERDYGFRGTNAIVETSDGTRFLIQDGYGGEHQLRGGQVRWDHGLVIQLLHQDTLESLHSGAWNDTTTHWIAMVHGYDPERPIMENHNPALMAKQAGLV